MPDVGKRRASVSTVASGSTAGFKSVESAVAYREPEAPYFETLLATAEK
jgi:hypothetical protein